MKEISEMQEREEERIRSMEVDLQWNHKWFDLQKDYNIKYTSQVKYSWLRKEDSVSE